MQFKGKAGKSRRPGFGVTPPEALRRFLLARLVLSRKPNRLSEFASERSILQPPRQGPCRHPMRLFGVMGPK